VDLVRPGRVEVDEEVRVDVDGGQEVGFLDAGAGVQVAT
jgi:hypothetical protein